MLRTFAARRLSPLSSPAESAGQVNALQTARQRERVDFFEKVSVGSGGNFTRIADQVRERKKKKDLWEAALTQMSLSRNHFNFCFSLLLFQMDR